MLLHTYTQVSIQIWSGSWETNQCGSWSWSGFVETLNLGFSKTFLLYFTWHVQRHFWTFSVQVKVFLGHFAVPGSGRGSISSKPIRIHADQDLKHCWYLAITMGHRQNESPFWFLFPVLFLQMILLGTYFRGSDLGWASYLYRTYTTKMLFDDNTGHQTKPLTGLSNANSTVLCFSIREILFKKSISSS